MAAFAARYLTTRRRKLLERLLKGGKITRDYSQSAEECSNGTTNDERVQDADLAWSVKSGIVEDYVPTNDLPRRSTRIRENRKTQNQVPKQNKRVTRKDTTHEGWNGTNGVLVNSLTLN